MTNATIAIGTERTWNVRLSRLWMEDHLDVWEDATKYPAPEGTFKGKVWIGTITEAQGREIISRCGVYDNTNGIEEWAHKYVYASQRTMDALRKQAPELFPRQPRMVIVETEDGTRVTWE